MVVAVPPIPEQRHILVSVHNIENPIEVVIQKNKSIIDRLQEAKNRLISDVVTGQIDVRDVNIPDFDYVEDVDDESQDEAENVED